MIINKLIKALLLPIILLGIFSFFTTTAQAGCWPSNPASVCDAAPGECSTTANGGESIIISAGIGTRECDEIVRYIPCTDIELYNNPDCQATETTSQECKDDPSKTYTTCIETTWEYCCTAGEPATECGNETCDAGETCGSCESDCGACQIEWCGDETCNNGETQSSCATDCGTAEFCGDNICGGGEDCNSCANDCGSCDSPSCGNSVCEAGEWCGNCSADCGSCTSCGDGSCNAGESCSSCSTDCGSCSSCGNGSCDSGETCASCATDCGSCASDFCGDTSCNGFETCDTCSLDCGVCAENEAWFQISAGNVGSANQGGASVAIQSNVTDTSDCIAPACVRSLLMEDLDSTSLTDGFAVVGSGTIDANGLITGERSENIYSSNTTKSRYQEKYEFFYRNSGLTAAPTSDFIGSDTDALKPTYNANDIVYFHNGNLTVQSQWSVTDGETYVIFVDGNLTLTDGDGASDQLIDVAEGGFLAFIVSGDIIVDEQLGNSTLSSTTANLEGVYIADGSLTIESRGAVAGGDDRFVGEGVFVGWSGVNLNRDFSDGAGRSTENNDKAVELFIYRPDFLVNMPDIMLVPIRIWQETN